MDLGLAQCFALDKPCAHRVGDQFYRRDALGADLMSERFDRRVEDRKHQRAISAGERAQRHGPIAGDDRLLVARGHALTVMGPGTRWSRSPEARKSRLLTFRGLVSATMSASRGELHA